MKKRKLALQTVALLVAYALACTDPRELSLHPAGLPARTVNASAASSAEPLPLARLSAEQIATVIHAVTPSLGSSCWQPRSVDAAVTPRVLLWLAIEPLGNVSQVQIAKAPAQFPDLAPCVVEGLRALRFADGPAGSKVSLSLAFSEKEPPLAAIVENRRLR